MLLIALTYRVPLCHVTPKEKEGDPGSRVPVPCLSTYTPPTAAVEGGVPSLQKTCPSPKANEVGTNTLEATSWACFPLWVVGPPEPAAALVAAKTPEASVSAATTVNPGLFNSVRTA